MGPLEAARSDSLQLPSISHGPHAAAAHSGLDASPDRALSAVCLIARLHHIAADPMTAFKNLRPDVDLVEPNTKHFFSDPK
jgi:hypothetical protein